MLFFEFLCLAIVLGTIAGVAWRYGESWLERRSASQADEVILGGTVEDPLDPPATTTTTTKTTDSSLN